MREMKDSGIEWIGEIPKDWNIVRLRFLAEIQTGNMDTQNRNPEGKYPFYVRSPIIEKSDNYTFDNEAILMAGDGVGAGKVFHYVNGKYGCHQRVYCISSFNSINPKFLYYYLSSNFYKKIEENNAKSTVDSVRLPMIKDFCVSIPNLLIQERIANYLEKKCEMIDRMIDKVQDEIKKLNEYKQSLITEIILKGFNNEPQIKQNDKYQHCRLKNVTSKITDGTHGTFSRVEEGKMLLSAKNVFEEGLKINDNESLISEEDYKNIISNGFPFENDILFCCVGTIGRCLLYKEKEIFAFQRSVAFIRTNNKILPEYLIYNLKSKPILEQEKLYVNKSAQEGLYQNSIKKLSVFMPIDLKEQQMLVNYLNDKCDGIDNILKKKQKIIDMARLYKNSLIYECVTGKKEVE